MRFVKTFFSWFVVFLFLVISWMFIQFITTPVSFPDPPGWKEHYEKYRNGPTPEEVIINQFHLNPSTQIDD